MENHNRIIELLQNINLSDEEKNELKMLSGSDDVEKLISIYNITEKTLRENLHISFDSLSDYVLIKNNLEPENKESYKLLPKIEEHLRKCDKCSEEFKELNLEFSDVDNFLSEQKVKSSLKTERKDLKSTLFTRKFFIPAFTLLFLVFILVIFSSLNTPDYYKYASIDDESEFYVTRGRVTENFQNSLKSLEEKNYNKAIEFLKKDIEENKNDETIFYSYYIAGLSYLEAAENSILGLFVSYDEQMAKTGIEFLKESVNKNTTGKFENITLNAYFYIAKGNLMLNSESGAKEYLQKVISGKGSKMNEAKNILSELE